MSESTVLVSPVVSGIEKVAAWLGRREKLVLLLGCTFQLLVLVAMIALRMVPLLTGDTLLLRVFPVDPRDMFRGDYVVLSYDFSRPPGAFPTNAMNGTTVYAQLEPEADGRHWRTAGFSTTPPAQGKFIRGRLIAGNRAEFGIESYYVQEGQGPKYEQPLRSRRVSAVVSVTSDGQAALKGLQIDPP